MCPDDSLPDNDALAAEASDLAGSSVSTAELQFELESLDEEIASVSVVDGKWHMDPDRMADWPAVIPPGASSIHALAAIIRRRCLVNRAIRTRAWTKWR